MDKVSHKLMGYYPTNYPSIIIAKMQLYQDIQGNYPSIPE